jgi:hypothetical protein
MDNNSAHYTLDTLWITGWILVSYYGNAIRCIFHKLIINALLPGWVSISPYNSAAEYLLKGIELLYMSGFPESKKIN